MTLVNPIYFAKIEYNKRPYTAAFQQYENGGNVVYFDTAQHTFEMPVNAFLSKIFSGEITIKQTLSNPKTDTTTLSERDAAFNFKQGHQYCFHSLVDDSVNIAYCIDVDGTIAHFIFEDNEFTMRNEPGNGVASLYRRPMVTVDVVDKGPAILAKTLRELIVDNIYASRYATGNTVTLKRFGDAIITRHIIRDGQHYVYIKSPTTGRVYCAPFHRFLESVADKSKTNK